MARVGENRKPHASQKTQMPDAPTPGILSNTPKYHQLFGVAGFVAAGLGVVLGCVTG